jgi:hypothetical protein
MREDDALGPGEANSVNQAGMVVRVRQDQVAPLAERAEDPEIRQIPA